MAPEIKQIGRSVHDYRVDIWCLGVTLYELCCKKLPFGKKGIHSKELKMSLSFSPHIEKEAQRLIEKMLQINPSERPTFQSIFDDPWFRKHTNAHPSCALQEEEHKILPTKEQPQRKKRNCRGTRINDSEDEKNIPLLPLVKWEHNKIRGKGDFMKNDITIGAWNINGLRTNMLTAPYLTDYVKETNPDILCLLELKIDMTSLKEAKLQDKLLSLNSSSYTVYADCCRTRKGTNGILILTKTPPLNVIIGMNNEEHDAEGRLITLEFQNFWVIGVYAPTTATAERYQYRTQRWDPDFRNFVDQLRESNKKNIVIIGDLNVCHTDLDVCDAIKLKDVELVPGNTDTERQNFEKLLGSCGFVDTFRTLYPHEKQYTYWNNFFARSLLRKPADEGRRLDYALVTQTLLPYIKDSRIIAQVEGSDHCPIELHLTNCNKIPLMK